MRSVPEQIAQTHVNQQLKPADCYQGLSVCLAPQLTSVFWCFFSMTHAIFPKLFPKACAM